MSRFLWIFVVVNTLWNAKVDGRIHTLLVENDERTVVVMTSFGYLKGGSLQVNITGLKTSEGGPKAKIGFSLDKSSSSGTLSYVEREESTRGCVLDKSDEEMFKDVPRAILRIVQEEGKSYLEVSERDLSGLQFYASPEAYEASLTKKTTSEKTVSTTEKTTSTEKAKTTEEQVKEAETEQKEPPNEEVDDSAGKGEKESSTPSARKRRAAVPPKPAETEAEETFVSVTTLPIVGDLHKGMNMTFYVKMEKDEHAGLYELYFHNCDNIMPASEYTDATLVNAAFRAHIIEKNGESYLSAGDMALPMMYGVMSAMFFFAGFIWLHVICKTNETVFKIHYLMAVIILVKGLSVMFHSLDYYFIAKDGRTEAWAVIYYVIHLLKGILLIICLLLIGSGWAFIKYILSDRDKKLFMIVIPMQVMANVAYIIMEETEEGNKSYYTWKDIVILVDVLCCGAILIPVVWSIRHLQEASQTDGKAAINLAKLELFRHFYILVVCYLYFTRIIVYLLEITLPFHYIWVHALFSELGAFVFFCITGYKFRPGCDNPYLKLEQYDSDEDPEEAITQSGAMENITKVNQQQKDVTETDEFDVLLPKQRTSKM